eukprot:15323783-Ditylum_brightwellii.AAC.1
MSYLQGTSHPDISMPAHQCAWFCNDPNLSHERAVRRSAKYLSVPSDRGLVYKLDPSLGIQCYVDADFAGCPVLWQSKLQTEITLSTAEA